jgi:uncharacterized membrane protein
MTTELLILRLVHVLAGIFWVGSTLLTTFFLLPAIATMGPAGGEVFAAVQRRKLPTFLLASALLTVASGLRLLWITSGGFSSGYFATAPGFGFATAGTSAILAFLLGVLVSRPAAMRAAKLGGTLASVTAERRAQIVSEVAVLRRRSAMAGTAAAALLVLAAAGMSVARYLG